MKKLLEQFEMTAICARAYKTTLISALLFLAACGGDKIIVTTDNSADYKSARQLPPLKKVFDREPASTNPQAPVATAPSRQAEPTAQTKPKPQSKPKPQAEQRQQQTVRSQQTIATAIAMNVVELPDNVARLKIETIDINKAWNYLLSELRKTTVTVQSRNEGSARVQIGCGQMNDGSNAVIKRSGWRISNRKDFVGEYCAMQLKQDDDSTYVSVLNRRGKEVSTADAMTVFNKIINNQ